MLGLTFGLKGAAAALAIGLLLGGWSGWKITRAFDESARFKREVAQRDAQITTLNERIRTINDAAAADARRAEETAAELRAEKERADGLQARITDGVCFDGPDADRVRDLWRNSPR